MAKPLLAALLLPGLLLAGFSARAEDRYFALTVGHVFAGAVDGDIDETETIPDYYKNYELEADRGNEIRLLIGRPNEGGGFYVSVGSMQAKDSMNAARHSFESLTMGGSYIGMMRLAGPMRGYGQFSLGVGASRFDSGLEPGVKTNALVEGQAELGLVFYQRLAVATGLKLQVLGYPTETIAYAVIPQANVSLWF